MERYPRFPTNYSDDWDDWRWHVGTAIVCTILFVLPIVCFWSSSHTLHVLGAIQIWFWGIMFFVSFLVGDDQ